ncbi:hypothetical protein LTR15_010010 [Elasticomyces elasticus]|nr:hypothetical protein LTR15_010010 [Elasticomyces elasticus]
MPEKLYGSVWQFQPIDLDVESSIQFHEPHPAPKLAYIIARRFGRRLERTYGWNGGMFELKAKKLSALASGSPPLMGDLIHDNDHLITGQHGHAMTKPLSFDARRAKVQSPSEIEWKDGN